MIFSLTVLAEYLHVQLRGRTQQLVNTPRLARLYSRLGSGDGMWFMVEKCTRYLSREYMLARLEASSTFVPIPNIRYKPYQLVWIADAWGACRLRDTFLFGRLARYSGIRWRPTCQAPGRYLSRVVPQLTSDQLLTVMEAYGRCEVTHAALMGRILNEVLKRKLSVLSRLCSSPSPSLGTAVR